MNKKYLNTLIKQKNAEIDKINQKIELCIQNKFYKNIEVLKVALTIETNFLNHLNRINESFTQKLKRIWFYSKLKSKIEQIRISAQYKFLEEIEYIE